MMDLCRNTLCTLGAAFIVGLGFSSGALAQSNIPIRIGMSLALTGAGASPAKVVNTALDVWRDDINAKGGLLGRPVELVVYDDQSTPTNELGPIANGLITGENFPAALAKQIAGASGFLARYGERAVAAHIDPLGFAWGPFAYSAGQVLAQAVTETKSLDHNKLAEYMHAASFKTVFGDFSFGKDGEWSKSRMVWTQVQNAQPNNLDQFRDRTAQPIVWPPEAKTGTLIYPYEKARQK